MRYTFQRQAPISWRLTNIFPENCRWPRTKRGKEDENNEVLTPRSATSVGGVPLLSTQARKVPNDRSTKATRANRSDLLCVQIYNCVFEVHFAPIQIYNIYIYILWQPIRVLETPYWTSSFIYVCWLCKKASILEPLSKSNRRVMAAKLAYFFKNTFQIL